MDASSEVVTMDYVVSEGTSFVQASGPLMLGAPVGVEEGDVEVSQ